MCQDATSLAAPLHLQHNQQALITELTHMRIMDTDSVVKNRSDKKPFVKNSKLFAIK